MQPPQYYSRFSQTAFSSGGNLPHWSQTCATFVTFRLADSLPEVKLSAFRKEREEWLKANPEPWNDATIAAYRENFPQRFHKWLDAGSGSCILADDMQRAIVEEALWHGAEVDAPHVDANVSFASDKDGQLPSDAFETNASTWTNASLGAGVDAATRGRDCLNRVETNRVTCPRYSLYAYVIMPNHVHVLFMPVEGEDGRRIVSEWKRYTARAINAHRGGKGAVWQKESYDHLVRDVREFNAYRAYIRGNAPERAFDAYAERDAFETNASTVSNYLFGRRDII